MPAEKKWTLVRMPDRRLVARVHEQVREVVMLRTLVDLQCNRYAIYREALLAAPHDQVEWPSSARP